MTRGPTAAIVALATSTLTLAENEVRFTEGPLARRTEKGVRISFALSAPTDVEVAVLDRSGKVVRHLAAGLLGGKNPPPPPLRPSLEQELVWDGNDDLGQPARNGPFRIRVRLGLAPKLDRYLGWDERLMCKNIVGLAVDRRGNLFVVLSDIGSGRSEVRVLDHTGRYLRTIMPYSASTPRERTAPIGHLIIGSERLPIVFNAHGQNLHPLVSGLKKQHIVVHPKGHLIFASAVGTWANHGPPRHLLALHPEGGAPKGVGFVGPQICPPRGFLGGAGERGSIALDSITTSPDGRYIYLTTNIRSSAYRKFRHHAVFRLQWTDRTLGEPFLGAKEPGRDENHFDDPQGITTDAEGNIYVCDRGNNRIVKFSPEGKFLGEFPVEYPQQLAIHPRTGALYVLCRKPGRSYRHPGTQLVKFSPWRGEHTPRELARLERGGLVMELFALDPTSSPPKLWAVLYAGWNRPDRLVPVLDRGNRFEIGKPINDAAGLDYPMFIAVDEARSRAYITHYRGRIDLLDLETGRVKVGFLRGNEVALDRQGNIYLTKGWTLVLERLDPAGRPLPFPALGTNRLGPWKLGTGSRGQTLWARSKGPDVGNRGHLVAPNGNLYIILMSQYGTGRLDVYGPDGALKKKGLLTDIIHGASGLAVDREGNIYLGLNVKPLEGTVYPFGFDGYVPTRGWRDWRRGKRPIPWWYPYYNAYLYHWGGVMKFPPSGGRFWQWRPSKTSHPQPPPHARIYRSGYLNRQVAVAGAEWFFQGYGPVPTSGLNWGDPSCTCWNARLAVDGFGRIFLPDVFRFSVEVLDPAGNHIGRIGRYGNQDDRDGVRLGWPAFIAAGESRIYISDVINRRVTVVKLGCTAEKSCPAE